MYVLTADQMQSMDQFTIQKLGISQDILMEKAALCVVSEIMKLNPVHVLCVCGNGNNGGDGIAVARILKMKGICATVYLCSEPQLCKESILKQLSIFQKVGGCIKTDCEFDEYDIIVDAVFGIGLNRPVSGRYADILERINETKKKKQVQIISLDIPSGIHADDGSIMEKAIKADITVSFAYPKRGHLLYPGREYTGRLVVADAGMYLEHSPLSVDEVGFAYLQREEFVLPKVNKTAHKGSRGRVLIIAGSAQMAGACYLSACAAFRTGCGLVEIYTATVNLESLRTMLPEAILHGYDEDKDLTILQELLERANLVVMGPGISTDEHALQCVNYVLNHCKKTMIIDADAINCIARNPVLLYNHVKITEQPVILTPHPKELSRLVNQPVKDILENYSEILVRTAKEMQCIIVGKGASSIVTDGTHFYINTSGNEGMATAGSGDVLTGIIAGILVQDNSVFDAVCKSVYLHGLSGDYMAERIGKSSLMAHDLLDGIIYLNKTEENR